MRNSNKRVGTHFENELANILSEYGYWVHVLVQGPAGQPADIIACNDKHTVLIDCKHCIGNSFKLNRIESNQWFAMDIFEKLTKQSAWIAVKFINPDDIFMIPISVLSLKKNLGFKEISRNLMPTVAFTLKDWLQSFKSDTIYVDTEFSMEVQKC